MVRLVYDLGFTGTAKGMTDAQSARFDEWLGLELGSGRLYSEAELHVGCCVGADDEAAVIGRHHRLCIVGHPGRGFNDPFRGKVQPHSLRPVRRELARNRDIANVSDVLAAAPSQTLSHMLGLNPDTPLVDRVRRSGTWATVRYAHKVFVPVVIFWACGAATLLPRNGTLEVLP